MFVDRVGRGERRHRRARDPQAPQVAGQTVIVFPEGTTFAGDEVRPFHAGAFVAALRTGAEIVPVGLAYQRGSGAAFVDESFLAAPRANGRRRPDARSPLGRRAAPDFAARPRPRPPRRRPPRGPGARPRRAGALRRPGVTASPPVALSSLRMQPPPVGTRVHVTWTDGKVYGASICAFAQGLVQVRWDMGGAPAWVPLHALVASPPPGPYGPPPAPTAWNPYAAHAPAPVPAPAPAPAPRPATPTPTANATPNANANATPTANANATPTATANAPPPKPALPPQPPPRPMAEQIGSLPRGLVYEPTAQGPGSGKSFFVLFGFLSTADVDLAMRMTDLEHLGDDVASLRAAGYRVVVDLHGTLDVLNAALTGVHAESAGTQTVGVFWGGHGDDDGSIGDHAGDRITPEQIAPEVAARATVRLFVMSACHAGSHASRWQKALGPQALIIGWGAPITNDRAIEFLTPSAASSKGFDDLLERQLGAKAVTADAPLAEAVELSRRHEDRIAALNLTFDELVDGAAARLKCPMTRSKSGEAYFTVRAPPSKDFPDRVRSQTVRVGPIGVGEAWLNVSSLVGPYSDALDLARALRVVTPSLHVRVALAKITPPDQEFVLVESLFRRRRLDPIVLGANIGVVGRYADRIEDMFFGSDQR